VSIDGRERNPTYRQLRAPARQGAYTVGQLVALAASAVLALLAAAGLLRLGAPIGLALTSGVVLAGAPPTVAIALEGREFGVLGLVRALVAWQRAPRRYEPGAAATTASGSRVRRRSERVGRTGRSNARSAR
jgi:hypothetical protein